jgi:hypothetical protein
VPNVECVSESTILNCPLVFSHAYLQFDIPERVFSIDISCLYKEATELTVLGGEAEVITSNVLRSLS